MSTFTPAAPRPVHGDSLRVGLRMAALVLTRQQPAESWVSEVIVANSKLLTLYEFQMEELVRGRAEIRRAIAIKTLEVLMVRSGKDSLDLTTTELDKLVERAWHVAGEMARMDAVGQQLDSLSAKG